MAAAFVADGLFLLPNCLLLSSPLVSTSSDSGSATTFTTTVHMELSSDIISNISSVRRKHLSVPDGSDGSDGTLYALTEHYTLPVAQATCRVAQQSTWEHLESQSSRLGKHQLLWERCRRAWNS